MLPKKDVGESGAAEIGITCVIGETGMWGDAATCIPASPEERPVLDADTVEKALMGVCSGALRCIGSLYVADR